jgi:maltooligosyltrehalose trehalohydrolase
MIRVWAPLASEMQLITAGRAATMQPAAGGWWEAAEGAVAGGQDYQFRVSGAVLPDPRSPWQPAGVHGASRHVDHAAFAWTDRHWQARPLGSAVIYELHIGTFTPRGTFDAAIERLDHLVELGVSHVELMPVAEFLGDFGWGYDGAALFAPHHAYGGPDGLKRLVNACHAKGLGVLLDVVYNHLGPSGNYLSRYGPYFTDRHATPWGPALNFDGPDSEEVRRFFCDNALMWLRDYHCDGLRLDAVHAIVDTSATTFLEQLATEVDELKAHLGRHLVLIAESDLNDPRVVRPWELGGFGMDAQWSDDIHHALHTVLTGERQGYYADFGDLADLATAMTQPYVYAGQHSEYRRRRHGRPPINLSAHRFVAYLQNHDQLGNHKQGERISHLVNLDRCKIGAALVLLSPYVPLLFQGEEWGATSPFQFFVDFHSEPKLAAAVREGRQREFASFGWQAAEVPDPTDPATFERSKLNWHDLAEPVHQKLLAWHRELIRLRRQVWAFTTGRLDETTAAFDEEQSWLRIERGLITIVCNFAPQQRVIPTAGRTGAVFLASKQGWELTGDAVKLPGESVLVFGPEWEREELPPPA